jgi:hypothetical protein
LEAAVDKLRLDALVEPIIADAESHMTWIDGRHLGTKKDAMFFSKVIAPHLEKLTAEARPLVIDRLVSFGRCLKSEFDSPEVSLTFLAGLEDAVGEPVPQPEPLHHTEGWTFKTKRRGGIRFESRMKVRSSRWPEIGA